MYRRLVDLHLQYRAAVLDLETSRMQVQSTSLPITGIVRVAARSYAVFVRCQADLNLLSVADGPDTDRFLSWLQSRLESQQRRIDLLLKGFARDYASALLRRTIAESRLECLRGEIKRLNARMFAGPATPEEQRRRELLSAGNWLPQDEPNITGL